MDEIAIKAAALTRIRKQARGRPLPIVTSEFSLSGTGIRADLAVLDDCFYGIEIKSESDTLKRLPNQMEGYSRYFDRIELVVAPKHLRGLKDINLHGAVVWRLEVLSDWQLYAPGVERRISGQWLLHLLTAEDERRAMRTIEQQRAELSAAELDSFRRTEFERAFRRRYFDTSAAFWKAVHGRRICSNDLRLLSRFYADREQQRQADEQRTASWSQWTAAMLATSN
jgi:hypothetical protein